MKKNHFFFLLTTCLLLGIGTAYYWYQKPVPSLEKRKADYITNAKELISTYQQNESNANELYLGKLMQIDGQVKELVTEGDQLSVILDGGKTDGEIVCELEPKAYTPIDLPEKGQAMTMKGECAGMLFDVVVLVRCVIIA